MRGEEGEPSRVAAGLPRGLGLGLGLGFGLPREVRLVEADSEVELLSSCEGQGGSYGSGGGFGSREEAALFLT